MHCMESGSITQQWKGSKNVRWNGVYTVNGNDDDHEKLQQQQQQPC